MAGYRQTLWIGYEAVQTPGLLTNPQILETQASLEAIRAGFRKAVVGTAPWDGSERIVYTSASPERAPDMMTELERFINDNDLLPLDPLISNIFNHSCTKIFLLQKDLGVSRLTAARYLNELVEGGILEKQRVGRYNCYINVSLFEILTKGG